MDAESKLAILFADVVGSTRLYEMLGDAKARAIVGLCIDLMKDATELHGGRVIKTMGDEVMATFATPRDAIEAADAMQKSIQSSERLQSDSIHVAIRIGCHFGPVVHEARDVFGTAVHIANRLTSQAKAGQIVTTASVVEQLTPERRMSVRQIDIASLKGQDDATVLYEILWESDELTRTVPSLGAVLGGGSRASCRLLVEHGGRSFTLDEASPRATIGRADRNTIVMAGELVSRSHARLEMHKGRFELVDESTNGTFVRFDSGVERFVRRDRLILEGSGALGIGQSAGSGSTAAIRFRCET